jgi:hypothetical protein
MAYAVASLRRQGPHLQDRPSESESRQRVCSDPQTAVVVNHQDRPADDSLQDGREEQTRGAQDAPVIVRLSGLNLMVVMALARKSWTHRPNVDSWMPRSLATVETVHRC